MMADVRALLKNERAARRIQHKHASYSTTGTLLCTVCRLQLKNDSLWDGHLRSAGHIMRAQNIVQPTSIPDVLPIADGNKKKRKASDDEDTIRKRTKATNPSLPEGFFDAAREEEALSQISTNEMQMKIPSRPATPLKTVPTIPSRPTANVDEDEWAAFEAEIAATESEPGPVNGSTGGVISAPAMTVAELKEREAEEDNKRLRERLEAEAERDKEDAARKMDEEFEQMESLEERVRKLREKREALRNKENMVALQVTLETPLAVDDLDEVDGDDDDDDDDYNDDWDGFRMRG